MHNKYYEVGWYREYFVPTHNTFFVGEEFMKKIIFDLDNTILMFDENYIKSYQVALKQNNLDSSYQNALVVHWQFALLVLKILSMQRSLLL